MKFKIIYALYIFLFTLVSFEVLLRFYNRNITWAEKCGHTYASGYNEWQPTWFFSRKPNAEFDVDQKDFKVHYKTNSLGIREREVFYTDTNATRIMCLGDSYTEGYGAPYDSSYPKILERQLNANGYHCQIYNAGIAASDPFYAYMLLKEKLSNAHPKIVLMTFNSSDLTDYIFRGGLERFKPDGTVLGRKGPWYEPIYAKSYVFRFILHSVSDKEYENLFLTQHEYKDIYCPEAVSATATVFDSISRLGKKRGFELLVIIQPIGAEIAFKFDRNDLTREILSRMDDSLQARGIKSINMYGALEGKITPDNLRRLAYPNDAHYTPAGYQLFADNLYNSIQKKYPSFFSGDPSTRPVNFK